HGERPPPCRARQGGSDLLDPVERLTLSDSSGQARCQPRPEPALTTPSLTPIMGSRFHPGAEALPPQISSEDTWQRTMNTPAYVSHPRRRGQAPAGRERGQAVALSVLTVREGAEHVTERSASMAEPKRESCHPEQQQRLRGETLPRARRYDACRPGRSGGDGGDVQRRRRAMGGVAREGQRDLGDFLTESQ